MTPEEARTVAAVMAGADGQCYTCAAWLAVEAMRTLPGHDWYALVAEAGHWRREMLTEAVGEAAP